jgi:bacterioferritin
MLEADLKAEQSARPLYQEAIAYCESCRDYISRELLEDILENEEQHIDWLEIQLEMIEKIGLENYLQSQMS